MNLISPELSDIDMEKFMNAALEEAELAGQAGELPIGAVVVIDGDIISRGRARHNEYKNQLRHAELNAMLDGGDLLWNKYQRSILFTTVEPCPLCLGAAVMADIPHIVFALQDKRMQSSQSVSSNSYINSHIKTYFGGVLKDKSIDLFRKHNPAALEYIQNAK